MNERYYLLLAGIIYVSLSTLNELLRVMDDLGEEVAGIRYQVGSNLQRFQVLHDSIYVLGLCENNIKTSTQQIRV